MFEGFTSETIKTRDGAIFLRRAGRGPPVLLVHGYPQTYMIWHAVAPRLAEKFSVVCADLRGYGRSAKPKTTPDHRPYSKRAMADEMVEVMAHLGHARFAVVGHDRGGRVAYRMAFDHPDRVAKLVVLDIVPTHAYWENMRWASALASFHWPFLAQPFDLPERMIGRDPRDWCGTLLKRWAAPGFVFAPEAMADYLDCFADPACVHATCEDYRAGAGCDHADDAADWGARKIAAPTLTLWGEAGLAKRGPNPLEVWRGWARAVSGHAMSCGHHLPEEAPGEVAGALEAFL